MPPWTIRQSTIVSSDSGLAAEIGGDGEAARCRTDVTRRRPKRPTRKPVIGVKMAVARMLKVVVQAISSAVAAKLPCICGSRVEATSKVVA